ncbi:glycosyltransferase [Hyunsoonleella pacifica]|uniref:Glycosyltransferase n=1 Tax=Hyunsoonleella pacifica TaxID=1080224 RepID=A0A4Q9FV02_9FLAO|nr:glycosyltransferase [Hyunsoonleella pacifica]TBN18525.1 glycosyltransferase [Hyunsoonleella pacifica]GGD02522.1 glycosyl transferase [Hyunsoonleella pacifica]
MRFLIISHTPHELKGGKYYAYEPYMREMNIWLKYVDTVEVVAPLVSGTLLTVKASYTHDNFVFTKVSEINFSSILNSITSLFKIPAIIFMLIKACNRADHVHLRCPGNIGALGCIVQLFYPKKVKTAKYAGNWDPNSKQPVSYQFQKWLLGNTYLTKNIQVLVYGNWENLSSNIKPFFTASFYESDKISIKKRDYNSNLNFVFVGSLVEGKRPLFAIQLVESLLKNKFDITLDIFGNGTQRDMLERYVKKQKLEYIVNFRGNQSIDVIKEKFQETHFLVLASKSEGWPKAIAEAMFYGTIPIATRVSCVPDMLSDGERGILILEDLQQAVKQVMEYMESNEKLHEMSESGVKWAQNYTLDYFESEIIKLLKN